MGEGQEKMDHDEEEADDDDDEEVSESEDVLLTQYAKSPIARKRFDEVYEDNKADDAQDNKKMSLHKGSSKPNLESLLALIPGELVQISKS